jgi:hypothetical protein
MTFWGYCEIRGGVLSYMNDRYHSNLHFCAYGIPVR